MAGNITDIKFQQTSLLIESSRTTDQKKDKEGSSIQRVVTTDILEISSQIEIINKQNSKTLNYDALEKKLGIDSSKWGVEAVSDDIFNFAKIMYDSYKLNHKGEEDDKVLEGFYNMAKDSITKGYNEARNFLGALPEDVATLAEGTFNRSIEKLDAWFKNGGKDVESSEDTTESQTTPETESKNEANETPKITTSQLLKESEEIKNQILKMLEDQGIFLKQVQEDREKERAKAKEEQQKQKTNFDIKA